MQMGHNPEIDVSGSEMFLREILTRKLSKEVTDFLYQEYHTMDFSVKQIQEGLQRLISYMDHSSPLSKQSRDKQTTSSSHPSSETSSQTQHSNQSTSVGTYSTTRTYSCLFCKKNHRPFDCTDYRTVAARRDRLKALNRCIKCTKNHEGKDCAIVIDICPRCGKGKHHSFMCVNTKSQASITKAQANPN